MVISITIVYSDDGKTSLLTIFVCALASLFLFVVIRPYKSKIYNFLLFITNLL